MNVDLLQVNKSEASYEFRNKNENVTPVQAKPDWHPNILDQPFATSSTSKNLKLASYHLCKNVYIDSPIHDLKLLLALLGGRGAYFVVTTTNKVSHYYWSLRYFGALYTAPKVDLLYGTLSQHKFMGLKPFGPLTQSLQRHLAHSKLVIGHWMCAMMIHLSDKERCGWHQWEGHSFTH